MAATKITIADKNPGDELTAAEFNAIKKAINDNAAILDLKADLINGIVDPEQLAKVYFQFQYGNGVEGDPFRNTPTAEGGGSGNITPAAPTNGVVDDVQNTFNFTFTPGYTAVSDYEYAIGSGTYATLAQKPISIGNVAIQAGFLKVRVKAAAGRNASPNLVNDTAFTVTGGGGSVELGSPATSFQYLLNFTSDGNGVVSRTDPAQSGAGALNFSLGTGETGFVSDRLKAFTITNEGATNPFSVGVGIDPFYGVNDAIISMWALNGGVVVYKLQDQSAVYSQGGVLSLNGIMRIRVTANTCYAEISNNDGVSFTQMGSIARPAGTLRVKLGSDGNQFRNVDLRTFKG